jgi:ribosomal-protein-alanine N-acetyltransferase
VTPRAFMTSLALARLADVAEIARIAREQVEDGLGWTWTPRRVATSVRRADALVVIARAGARVAGFGVMRYGDEEAHLDLLAVDRAYRRRGLGRRLVEWLEKPALVAGITDVFLEVREPRLDARAFYARLGYRELGRIAGYYQGREAAIRMGRDLSIAEADPQ